MKNPTIGKNVYIAEGAVVRGDVTIGDESSVWFNAVIRADREPVVIGRGTNIQDNSVVHVETGAGVVIGNHVTVGHNAVVHGCTIGDNSLIGMNAVIMNNAVLGMVRQWQDAFYGRRFASSEPERLTDYVKVAEGFGAKGYRCTNIAEFRSVFAEALKMDGPVWIDCAIDREEKVLPMIPAGGSVGDTIMN